MEIKKLTDKFEFRQEGAGYILDLGSIKSGGDRKTEFTITGVEDANLVTIHPTCGCTGSDTKLINKETLAFSLSYNSCDSSFAKVVQIKYNNVNISSIKITGRCS